MTLGKRQGNNPKYRFIEMDKLDSACLARIVENCCYVGSAHHKTKPSNYGFIPPVSPRSHKSLCDLSRSLPVDEAKALFEAGLKRGMISSHFVDGLPKYVWAVDPDGNVYEAKVSGNDGEYHGYQLYGKKSQSMRRLVKQEWEARCPII